MTVSLPRNIVGFADRTITTLKYSESYSFSASPTPAAQVWLVNSCFDPNLTGVGHQPSYYDTYSVVYNRYFVQEFKVIVYLTNHTTTCGLFAVLATADQNQSGNTVEQIAEAKYSILKMAGFAASGAATLRLELPWLSQMQLMGQPYTEADDNMYALITASPADQLFAYLKVAADDAATNVSVIARVELYQRVVFKDLLTQVSS